MSAARNTISLKEVEAIIDAYNRHDVDAIVDSFTENGVFELSRGEKPWGTRLGGRTQIRKFLTDRFSKTSDMRWKTRDLWVSGNRAVLEFLVIGTFNDGRKFKRHGCDLWTFQGKKVARKDTYWKSDEPAV